MRHSHFRRIAATGAVVGGVCGIAANAALLGFYALAQPWEWVQPMGVARAGERRDRRCGWRGGATAHRVPQSCRWGKMGPGRWCAPKCAPQQDLSAQTQIRG